MLPCFLHMLWYRDGHISHVRSWPPNSDSFHTYAYTRSQAQQLPPSRNPTPTSSTTKEPQPCNKTVPSSYTQFSPVDLTSKRLKEKTPDLITIVSSLLPMEPATVYRLASSSSPSLSVSSFLVQNGKRWRLPLRGALSLTAWPDPDPAPGDTVP